MPGAESYALILSFRTEVLADALVRVLNDALTLDPRSSRFLPRRLDLPDPHSLLWWDQPALTLDQSGHVVLSLAFAGGVRQAALPGGPARIASVDGTLRARYEPALGATAGSPHLTLALEALDLSGLRIHYAGSNPLPLLDPAGGRNALVTALVKDAAAMLAAQPLLSDFMGSLGRRPLSYVPAAFSIPSASDATTIRNFGPKAGDALVIAVADPPAPTDAHMLANPLASSAPGNAAVTLSAGYLNSRLASLLAGGQIQRMLWDTNGAELAHLDSLSVALDMERITLVGHVTRGTAGANLRVVLSLSLDEKTNLARVAVEQTSIELDTVRAGSGGILSEMEAQDALHSIPRHLSRTYWPELVATLLGGRIEDDALNLTQRFVLPGTAVALDAPLVALEVGTDSLTLFSAIRPDGRFIAEPPHRTPRVAVAQRNVPTQAAPHAPVEALAEAQILAPSYPPYDFAWESDPSQPVPDLHQPALPVHGIPTGMTGDPEGIARVRVSLIDSFGQVAHHDAQVVAHPAQRQRQQQQRTDPRPRSPLRVLLSAALAVALVITGAAVVYSRINSGNGASPATPPMQIFPAATFDQTCEPAVQTLAPTTLTLDNSAGTVGLTWNASVLDDAPNSAEPWAALTQSSGTIPAKGVGTISITPAADLCERMHGATTQRVFSVTLSYTAAASSFRGLNTLAALDTSASSVLSSASRQVTIADTVNSVNFSAYVVNVDGVPVTNLTATCDDNFVLRPAEFTLVLDNTQSTAADSWQIMVKDPAAPPAAPAAAASGTPIPTPTPAAPELWAQATSMSGNLPAGQRTRVGVVSAKDLCARIGAGTSPAPFHLLVTLGDGSQITITDTVTPTRPVLAFVVAVSDKAATSPTSLVQQCDFNRDPLPSFNLTLDNAASNAPVTWQIATSDTALPPGTPTPAPGPAELWATPEVPTGTIAPSPEASTFDPIVPAADLCHNLPPSASVTYHIVVTWSGGNPIIITDTVTTPTPIQ